MTLAIISQRRERRYRSPAVAGTLSTTFTLTTTAASATYPFSMGMFFKKGDVPGGIECSDLVGYQVVPKRTWSDGSLKHCIISGRAALVLNTPKTITVTNGTAPTGTDLTAADIAAAAPTAAFTVGVNSVQLASLLATPIRTWVSGPEMVECHYQAQFPVSTLVAVWFHVRLFADDRIWIRVIVENGKLDNGSGALFSGGNSSYVPTISIDGVNVFTNGGATLTHYDHTRYSVEGWIGGNPAVTPGHNPAYMISTKLVPNYHWRSPSASTLNGLTQTYTPMSNGPIIADTRAQGFQDHIGILPKWDALYAATGDARAFRAMLTGSSCINSYPIVWRDFTTKLPHKPSAFPTTTVLGFTNGGGSVNWSAGPLIWDAAHHPSSYLAYLCTGDYWHYETMALQSSFYWLTVTSARGSGVNRRVNSNQTRAIAWGHRSFGQYTAVAPDGDAVAAEYRTTLANDYAYWKTTWIDPNYSQIGYLCAMNIYDEGVPPMSIPAFEQHFMIQSIGYVWDLEPGFTAPQITVQQAVRDYLYKAIVGILGPNGAENWCFTRAGIAQEWNPPVGADLRVGTFVATAAPQPFGFTPNFFLDTWGEVWQLSWGSPNTACANTLENGTLLPTTYSSKWANLLPAIGFAVDHAATGASEAWARLTGATNFAAIYPASGYNEVPIFGIPPRSYAGP